MGRRVEEGWGARDNVDERWRRERVKNWGKEGAERAGREAVAYLEAIGDAAPPPLAEPVNYCNICCTLFLLQNIEIYAPIHKNASASGRPQIIYRGLSLDSTGFPSPDLLTLCPLT